LSSSFGFCESRLSLALDLLSPIAMATDEHDNLDIDNLANLEDFNRDNILAVLKYRFSNDDIYTSIGSILVSINPFRLLPIYTNEILEEYKHAEKLMNLPPHVFGIAADAYFGLINERDNHSVVISGESGAGKTEATKLILQYLSEVAGSESGVEQEILESNPVLEAFGNAKTVRNNNSSRFGKWQEISFSRGGRIVGARIVNYLLEKTRVVQQAPTERNYHIFYQITSNALRKDLKDEFHILSADQFNYLNKSGCMKIDGHDDEQGWKDTVRALARLKFSTSDISGIVRLLAVVLWAGNIELKLGAGDKCVVVNTDVLARVADMLCVSQEALSQALCFRSVTIRGETSNIPLTVEGALGARDAMTKAVYNKLFDWLVVRINDTLGQHSGHNPAQAASTSTIGVLDIFGFEIFERNSLEQMFINYANEKLQQHFNRFIFKEEQAEYAADGIDVAKIEFVDNQVCLDLIEMKGGLLKQIDEEVVVPRGNDKSLLDKMMKDHLRKHPNFDQIRKQPDVFVIKHYAGDVAYHVEGFVEKNKDQLPENLLNLLEHSQAPLMRELFVLSKIEEAPAKPVRGGATMKASSQTLGRKFSSQLSDLAAALGRTTPHFIRCIKPNVEKAGKIFTEDMVMSQMKNAGLFEAIRIRASGFPLRKEHAAFMGRFRCLVPKGHKLAGETSQEQVKALLELVKDRLDLNEIRVGRTKVFWRSSQQAPLEKLRAEALRGAVIRLQCFGRGIIARRLYANMKKLQRVCVEALRSGELEAVRNALRLADELQVQLFILWEVRDVLVLLQEAQKIVAVMQAACESQDEAVLRSSVVKAEAYLNKYREKNVVAMVEKAKNVIAEIERKRREEMENIIKAALESNDEGELRAAITSGDKYQATYREKGGSVEKLVTQAREAVAEILRLRREEEERKRKEEEEARRKAEEEARLAREQAEREKREEEERRLAELASQNAAAAQQEKERIERERAQRAAEENALRAKEAEERKRLDEQVPPPPPEDDLPPPPPPEDDEMPPPPPEDEELPPPPPNFFYDDLPEPDLPPPPPDFHEEFAINFHETPASPPRSPVLSPAHYATPPKPKFEMKTRAAPLPPASGDREDWDVMIKKKGRHLHLFARFPGLRTEGNYSKGCFLNKKEVLKKRLVWQKDACVRSLVRLNTEYLSGAERKKELNLMAKNNFKNVQCFMKDIYHAYPTSCGHQVLHTGYYEPKLRDEIYCQLIKQTRSNPSRESELLGWRLMYFSLRAFPPSEDLASIIIEHILDQVPREYRPLDTVSMSTSSDVATHCFKAWYERKTRRHLPTLEEFSDICGKMEKGLYRVEKAEKKQDEVEEDEKKASTGDAGPEEKDGPDFHGDADFPPPPPPPSDETPAPLFHDEMRPAAAMASPTSGRPKFTHFQY